MKHFVFLVVNMSRLLQICFIFTIIRSSFSGLMPKMYVTIDRITPVNIPGYFKMIPTLYNAGQKNLTMDEDIIIEQDLPTNALFSMRIQELVKGKYVELGFSIRKNLCEFIKNDMIFIPALAKHGNFTAHCPLKRGLFVVRDFTVSGINAPIFSKQASYRIYLEYRIAGRASVMQMDLSAVPEK